MYSTAFWFSGVRAELKSDFAMREGAVHVDGQPVLDLDSRQGSWRGHTLELRGETLEALELLVDGRPAEREDRMRAPISRSAWIHAILALLASFAGFVASWLYLRQSEGGDPWSLKMAIHMAGWHLLLTLTLFPAAVWGQRVGIRAVQGICGLFFFIHVGIAMANLDGSSSFAIAFFNAASGIFFLAALFYGQRAHRDMNPVRAYLGECPP